MTKRFAAPSAHPSPYLLNSKGHFIAIFDALLFKLTHYPRMTFVTFDAAASSRLRAAQKRVQRLAPKDNLLTRCRLDILHLAIFDGNAKIPHGQ
jgi:hypothetical protein